MDSKFQDEYLEEVGRMTRDFATAVSTMNKAIKQITDLGHGYALNFEEAIAEITDVKERLRTTHSMAMDMLMESI
jgi:hypothetical protein